MHACIFISVCVHRSKVSLSCRSSSGANILVLERGSLILLWRQGLSMNKPGWLVSKPKGLAASLLLPTAGNYRDVPPSPAFFTWLLGWRPSPDTLMTSTLLLSSTYHFLHVKHRSGERGRGRELFKDAGLSSQHHFSASSLLMLTSRDTIL